MTNSFALYKGNKIISIKEICTKLSTHKSVVNLLEMEDISLGFSHMFCEEYYLKIGHLSIWLIPTAYDSHIDQNNITALVSLLEQKEYSSLGQLELPSFIAFSQKTKQLFVYSSSPGYLPIYYGQNDNGFWITSEAKALIHCSHFSLKLRPYSFFKSLNYQHEQNNKSIFEDLYRLMSHQLLVIEADDTRQLIDVTPPLNNISLSDELAITKELYQQLNNAFKTATKNAKHTGVSLSGGYDSGSIAGLMKVNSAPFTSYTLGSQAVNEFKEAEEITSFCHGKNVQVDISPADYFTKYLQTIYLNEISEPVIAEAFISVYKTYEVASKSCSDLLTGYGADILLGNLFSEETAHINSTSQNTLKRTATSGELSPFIADQFGLKIHPIYLRPSVIKYCLNISGDLKIKSGINKYIQREMISQFKLMPKALLKIKKKGLHEGAGLPAMFGQLLQTKAGDYETKRRFLYHCLQLLFEEGIPVNKIDFNLLIKDKNYDRKGTKRWGVDHEIHASKAAKPIR